MKNAHLLTSLMLVLAAQACQPGVRTQPSASNAEVHQASADDRVGNAIKNCPSVLVIKADSLAAHLSLELVKAKANIGGSIDRKATAAVTNAAALGTFLGTFGCRASILAPASGGTAAELLIASSEAWQNVYAGKGKGAAAMEAARGAHLKKINQDVPDVALSTTVSQDEVMKAFQSSDLMTLTSIRSDAGVDLGTLVGGAFGKANIKLDAKDVDYAIQSLQGNTLNAAQNIPAFWRTYLASGTSKRALFLAVVSAIYDIGSQLEATQ